MSVRSAARVLELIEWLAARESAVGLADICQALDLPKSSTLLLLKTLVESGYAVRGPEGRYRLVRLPGELSPGRAAWGTILRIAEPILRDAVARVEETGFIAVLTETWRIQYLNKILPSREIRYDRDISRERIPHHVASGIAILAAMPDEDVGRYIATLGDELLGQERPKDIRALIAKARAAGVAINLKGRVEGASGVAAAILDAEGRPIAALNLSGPSGRFEENLEFIARTAVEAAHRIRAELIRRVSHVRNTHIGNTGGRKTSCESKAPLRP